MSGASRRIFREPWELDLGAASGPAPDMDGVDAFCVGLADEVSPHVVLTYACNRQLGHLVQRQGFDFERERAAAALMIREPDLFRRRPVATILSPENPTAEFEHRATVHDERFNSSRQKRGVLDNIQDAMTGTGVSQSVMEDVILVADEFFTNAVFNAPFVDPVTSINPGIDRHTAEVRFDGDKAGRMWLAQNQNCLVVGCEDPFGSLRIDSFLRKIRETYARGPAATMNFGPGGAGLGSYIIFNAGTSLYFGNWPGESTVLSCVMPLGLSNRKRVQLAKHLHWVQR